MSSTPEISVLSKKQQNKTLSARKKPLKTIRNILSSKNISCWPILDDTTILIAELECLKFSKSKNDNDNKPMEIDCEDVNELRKIVLFGVNEVGRCLKNNECSALIFDADVPRILVQHLIYMATSKAIPFAGVSGLTNIIRTNYGFKSSTVCFKVEPSNKFSKIIDIIKINFPTEYVSETPMECTSEPREIISTSKNKGLDVICLEPATNVIYLQRKNRKERAFVPPICATVATTNPVEQRDAKSTYISIEKEKNYGMNKSEQNKSSNLKIIKTNFKPLLVHKVQNNVNRIKKKTVQ